MPKQTVVVINEKTVDDEIGKWLGIAGIVATVIGVLYFISSCESGKRAKEEAAASIDETIVVDEANAFGKMEKMRVAAEIERAARLEADQREDAIREEERRRREAAVKAAAEEAAAIEREATKEAERQSAMKDFVMAEAPSVWTALQNERAERDSLDKRLAEIEAAANGDSSEMLENDESYLAVVRQRNASIRRIRTGSDALETAFKLAAQAKASPEDESLVEQKAVALRTAKAAFSADGINNK